MSLEFDSFQLCLFEKGRKAVLSPSIVRLVLVRLLREEAYDAVVMLYGNVIQARVGRHMVSDGILKHKKPDDFDVIVRLYEELMKDQGHLKQTVLLATKRYATARLESCNYVGGCNFDAIQHLNIGFSTILDDFFSLTFRILPCASHSCTGNGTGVPKQTTVSVVYSHYGVEFSNITVDIKRAWLQGISSIICQCIKDH
jgi:hypothetical protein